MRARIQNDNLNSVYISTSTQMCMHNTVGYIHSQYSNLQSYWKIQIGIWNVRVISVTGQSLKMFSSRQMSISCWQRADGRRWESSRQMGGRYITWVLSISHPPCTSMMGRSLAHVRDVWNTPAQAPRARQQRFKCYWMFSIETLLWHFVNMHRWHVASHYNTLHF